MSTEPSPEPILTVVRGDPTPEELAAVLTVLAARAPVPQTGSSRAGTSGWSAYWRNIGAPLVPGPGAWRSSGSPG